MNTKLARQSKLHLQYIRCEKLGTAIGMSNPDGLKISTALLKAERLGAKRAEAMCNDSGYRSADADKARVFGMVSAAFGKLPPGFFLNSDPRGHALKIDNETPEGKALIEQVGLETDWGGYGILSPEI